MKLILPKYRVFKAKSRDEVLNAPFRCNVNVGTCWTRSTRVPNLPEILRNSEKTGVPSYSNSHHRKSDADPPDLGFFSPSLPKFFLVPVADSLLGAKE